MGFFTCVQFIKRLLIEIKFQLIYYILGGTSQIDDFIYAWSNKVELADRSGQVAVITGGARGIGVHVVRMLLQCNIHVIIGCRNVKAGEDAVAGIRAAGVQTGACDVLPLDTSSLASVRLFARVVASAHPAIHILINNAGIMFVPFSLTEDGFESHQAVNYLGHFLLTQELQPCLEAAGRENPGIKARIVNVTSCAYMVGEIKFSDFNNMNGYIASAAYAQSKLAQLMSAVYLSSYYVENNMPINVYAVHPGIVNTELFDGTSFKKVFPWIPKLLFKSPEKGAMPIVYAATSPTLEDKSGVYISNCRVMKIKHKSASNLSEVGSLHQFTVDLLQNAKPS